MNTTTKKAANSIVGKLTAGILAIAAVAAGAFAAVFPSQATAAESVLVVGDSLEVGSGSYLKEALPGSSVEVDAVKGRSSATGLEVLAGRLRPEHTVVVFPMGTNDSPADTAGFAARLSSAAQLAGDRCLVVATLVRPPLGGVPVAGMNQVVQRFAAQSGAEVMDWAAVVDAFPDLLVGDGVHATTDGYSLRGSLLAESVHACGAAAGGSDLTGLPAPRNPNAKPPPRLAPGSELSLSVPFGPVFGRAISIVAVATRSAFGLASRPEPEPVLGAP
jgi:lysophospholipase L1-like esterase